MGTAKERNQFHVTYGPVKTIHVLRIAGWTVHSGSLTVSVLGLHPYEILNSLIPSFSHYLNRAQIK